MLKIRRPLIFTTIPENALGLKRNVILPAALLSVIGGFGGLEYRQDVNYTLWFSKLCIYSLTEVSVAEIKLTCV